MSMQISLTPEQAAWLTAHVERGELASIDEAARQLLDERIAERVVEDNDDLAWAKPMVDEAMEEVSCGKVMTREERDARMSARLASTTG